MIRLSISMHLSVKYNKENLSRIEYCNNCIWQHVKICFVLNWNFHKEFLFLHFFPLCFVGCHDRVWVIVSVDTLADLLWCLRHLCANVCVCVFVWTCMCVWMCECLYLCLCPCMTVCICVFVSVYVCMCTCICVCDFPAFYYSKGLRKSENGPHRLKYSCCHRCFWYKIASKRNLRAKLSQYSHSFTDTIL
jgi:hypothetical protein